jgi:hypothetical protein
MTDVRELLTNAAARPTSELDVDAVLGTARRRRRTRVGIAVGCVVAVAAIAGGLSLRLENSSVHVATTPRQEASTVPAGWTELKLPDAGLRLAIPPGWTQLEQYAPPSVPPSDGTPTLSEAVIVGSSGHPRTGEISGCTELGQTPVVLGTWMSLYEIQGYQPGSDLVLPAGERLSAGAVLDRPVDFRTVGGTQGSCGSGTSSTGSAATSASFEVVSFRDAGRLFLARIVTTADPNRDGIGVGNQVLNTLVVEPSQTTETPKVSVVTTLPTPTVTTQAPTPTTPAPTSTTQVPTSDTNTPEEAAVRTAFLAWINAQPKDGLDEFVEDFASIQDSLRQGMAQHSAADLTKYSGRVDSVQIVDETHASVVYSVLFNGAPEFSQRPGVAIKIDGVWKVSRDTVCDLLTLGGITCPLRSGA